MKIPNADNLAKVPSSNVVIPTIESETNSTEIVIVMKDGTTGRYVNEGCIEFGDKYNNIDEYFDHVGLMESDMPEIDKLITNDIKKSYPNVEKVYVLNL
jgi:hypothetical protein